MRSQSSRVASRRFVNTIVSSLPVADDRRSRHDAEDVGQAGAAFAPPGGQDLRVRPDREVADAEVKIAPRLGRVVDLGPWLDARRQTADQHIPLDLADVR